MQCLCSVYAVSMLCLCCVCRRAWACESVRHIRTRIEIRWRRGCVDHLVRRNLLHLRKLHGLLGLWGLLHLHGLRGLLELWKRGRLLHLLELHGLLDMLKRGCLLDLRCRKAITESIKEQLPLLL